MSEMAAVSRATGGALRYAAGLMFGLDEDLAGQLYEVAAEVERNDWADSMCCPVCEEVTCDEGCPCEPYREQNVRP